jgi:release factor glutamine methyltransferase
VLATDRSEAALEVAAPNAARHGVEARVEFVRGDGCAPLVGRDPFDLVVSNPPYICRGEMADLAPAVTDWEPRGALESGDDGMDVTTPLVEQAFACLVPGGWLLVEVGTQAALVRDAFVRGGYEGVAVRRDLAGIDRVVIGRRPA